MQVIANNLLVYIRRHFPLQKKLRKLVSGRLFVIRFALSYQKRHSPQFSSHVYSG